MNGLVKVALAGDGLGDYIFGLDPQLLVDSAITILAMFAMFLLFVTSSFQSCKGSS